MKPSVTLIFLLSTALLQAQTFNLQLGEEFEDQAHSVVELDNGDVIIASSSEFSTGRDITLYRLSSDGSVVWQHDMGFASGLHYLPNDLVLTNDGNVILSSTVFDGLEDRWGYIVKIDPDGNIIWESTVDPDDFDLYFMFDLIELADGQLMACGRAEDLIEPVSLILWKFDSLGNLIWTVTDSNLGYTSEREIIELPDGDLLVAGGLVVNGFGQIGLSKFSADGQHLWTETFDIEGDVSVNGMTLTLDGNWRIFGNTTNATWGNGPHFAFIIETDSDGNELWTRQYHHDEQMTFNSLVMTSDNGSKVVGSIGPHGEEDGLLMSIDLSGDSLWSETYGFDFDDVLHDAVLSSDESNLWLVGSTEGEFEEEDNCLIIRADADGIVSSASDYEVVEIQLFPNPVENLLTIDLGSIDLTGAVLSVHSITGALIRQKAILSDSTLHLDMSGLDSGTYMIQIINGSINMTEVIVKL